MRTGHRSLGLLGTSRGRGPWIVRAPLTGNERLASCERALLGSSSLWRYDMEHETNDNLVQGSCLYIVNDHRVDPLVSDWN